MWSSIANLKENLNKIALDVHEDDDEEGLEIYCRSTNGDDSLSAIDRRKSHQFAQSKPESQLVNCNGVDPGYYSEIEQYKSEIKRLQDSEAEIKALSVNYAALLKEKESLVSQLNQENGSLKKSLDSTTAALNASRHEKTNSHQHMLKGNGDQSPNRNQKPTIQMKSRPGQNGVFSKQDGLSNGLAIQGKEKALTDLLEEKDKTLASLQCRYELEMGQLRMEVEKERDKLANLQLQLQEKHHLSDSLQEELKSLKLDKEKYLQTFMEMGNIRRDLDGKVSEVEQLQKELNMRKEKSADDSMESLKRVIASLEKENNSIKGMSPYGSFHGKEEMELSTQKLEKDLKEACRERDRALQELARLKQHLLEKESEESDKMDEDSKLIEELRQSNEYQRAQILHLERALKQAMASQEEIKMRNDSELKKLRENNVDLNKKLAICTDKIDAKNAELLNLQTALGQYYAEIEAKEHLEGDLGAERKESARLSALLKDVYQELEMMKKEKDEILAKLSKTDRTLLEAKSRMNKLEEDNAKLRRALEQSMTRLNRMSVDSDYLVDRRIVIKLLVTYFLRNHSKEVLDLMVRMLGFSEEDKQRIGLARQGAGKGVVRGVLGLPGRLVGGVLGGASAGAHAHTHTAADNQSFADLWVDFLLKETEEREKREAAEAAGEEYKGSTSTPGRSPGTSAAPLSHESAIASLPSHSGLLEHSSDVHSYRVNIDSQLSTSRSSRLPSK